MNRNEFKTSLVSAIFLSLAATLVIPLQAEPVPASATTPGNKLVTTYSTFAGSPENSASLVQGLRTGSPITLTDPPVVGGPPPVSTTFTAPTRPMGYGNIRIALSLAEAQLASQGVTNPSAAELQGALIGSTVVGPNGTTTTDGVLQMRASGMGWGQIANTMGYKLGPIMSGKQTLVTTNPAGSSVTTAAGSGNAGVATAKGKGVVTGTGVAADGAKGVTTAAGSSAAHGHSSGITTGLGPASSNAGGVVTAAGGKAGSNAGSNAGGNGKGGGKP